MEKDEITLKQLILQIKSYFKEILKKWWIVAFCILVFGSYFLYNHFTNVKLYKAKISFFVEGGQSSSSSFGGILGQIGMGGGNSLVNPYKIIEVASSNKLTLKLLQDTFKNDIIANHLIDDFELQKHWSETSDKWSEFKFLGDTIILSDQSNSLAFIKIKKLLWSSNNGIIDNSALSIDIDQNTGMFNLSATSRSEDLAYILADRLYENLRQFFEYDILINKYKSLNVLSQKLDSLDNLRLQKNLELAKFDRSNKNVFEDMELVKKDIIIQDLQLITRSYGEVLRNYELTDFELKNTKPLFVLINAPIKPLSPVLSRLRKAVTNTLIFGTFFGILVVIMMKSYKDIMN